MAVPSSSTHYTATCSSFDEYAAEVKSGRLEWSPVHRSDKFWVSFVIQCCQIENEVIVYAVLLACKSPSVVGSLKHVHFVDLHIVACV